MYGDEAYKLVKEAKRATDHLLPYNQELVSSVSREIRALSSEYDAALAALRARGATHMDDPGAACAILVRQLATKRDKRCLFAYHLQRLERIKEAAWGTPMGVKDPPPQIRQCLSRDENKFFEEYRTNVIGAYQRLFIDVDLHGGGLDPPKDLFIEVRVTKDCGEIQTEYGFLNLTMGSQFFVRRTDVESLIKQGFLKHIT
ncbi:DNA replication complex GINS protein psf1 [Endogone sp. FLAS-F59071]|nr:DNA replication complex GINS protein psf1 [Endogone sp. FLAS-F59071]|eukprot:RUS23288.1 DNA replication complex GINS protein psf1 [Endogone sp. FLAS-F59071]